MAVSGFLKTILEIKHREVARARTSISLNTVRSDAEQMPAGPDFQDAMAQGNEKQVGIIAEIKKASPSKGDIRRDLDPEQYARMYETAGAKAISVLTESEYFKGSLTDLKTACLHTALPVLRKDFIIDAYQIYEAKRAGAASILLITTLLSRDQQADYVSLTRELSMEPLVEINSEYEFEQAHYANAGVIGINNRNLATLEVDVTAARRIAAIFPESIIPVAASGVSDRKDIDQGIDARIYNFLIGESIVRADDAVGFIRSLISGKG